VEIRENGQQQPVAIEFKFPADDDERTRMFAFRPRVKITIDQDVAR
jgi:hypothetical protein